MNIEQLLLSLKDQAIRVQLKDDKLRFSAPAGGISEQTKQLIKAHKDEIKSYLQQMQHKPAAVKRPSIVATARAATSVLSFSQQRLWFVDRLQGQSAEYNMPMALQVSGAFDVAAAELAICRIIQRHETLRTVYAEQDGQPVQKVSSSFDFKLTTHSLPGLNDTEQQQQVTALISADGKRSFDLSADLMLRVFYIELSEQDGLPQGVLFINQHHIISDGWSSGILLNEFVQQYQAAIKGQADPLPPLTLQYIDYAIWQQAQQQQTLDQTNLHQQYWVQHLSGASEQIGLLYDMPSEDAGRPAATITRQMNATEVDKLKALSKDYGTTLFMTLLSSLYTLLYRWTGQDDLSVGTVVAGRHAPETEPLIGCFMNTLVLRANLLPQMKGADLLHQVMTTVTESFKHQQYPFEQVVQSLSSSRESGKNPLFNVSLLLQNFAVSDLSVDGLQIKEIEMPAATALMDLRFVIVQSNVQGKQGLTINCEYDSSRFEAATMTALVDGFELMMAQLVTHTDTALADYRLPEALSAQMVTHHQANPTMVVAATFTADPIKDSLDFWSSHSLSHSLQHQSQQPLQTVLADYNQVFQQLLDPSSTMAQNTAGANLILLRFDDWLGTDAANPIDTLKANVAEFVSILTRRLAQHTGQSAIPHIVVFCPPAPASQANAPLFEAMRQAEQTITGALADISNGFTLDWASVNAQYPVLDYFDQSGQRVAHMPYTPAAFVALGSAVYRYFDAIRRAAFKVIVLDCDNTLWQGVCGEGQSEGKNEVVVTAAHRWFQSFCLAQKNQGVLLALCSKNNLDDAVSVFNNHPDMLLSMEDIAAHRINWELKSDNILALAQELNLDPQSFIFVDDDALQCAEVRQNLPQVMTIQIPKDHQLIQPFIEHTWAFDQVAVDTLSHERSEHYIKNKARVALQAQSGGLLDYITSLELKIEVQDLSERYMTRAEEMMQRTNQFNLTTRRLNQSDIQQQLALPDAGGLMVNVADRFGDYGMVGLLLYRFENQQLVISDFVLSCRALGRGVEHYIVRHLSALAEQNTKQNTKQNKAKQLRFLFKQNSKNIPASLFLQQLYGDGQSVKVLNSVDVSVAQAAACQLHEKSAESAEQPTSNNIISNDNVLDRQSAGQSQIALELNDVAAITLAIHQAKPKHQVKHQAVIYKAPQSDNEIKLAGLWQSLLNISDVASISVNDHFFAVGGHSLLAVQLISAIRQHFAVELSIKDLFDHPELAVLAALIGDRALEDNAALRPTINALTRVAGEPLLTSFAQQRLWFIDQLQGGSTEYNMAAALKVDGHFDVAVAQQAVVRIIQRHETLRTTFVAKDNQTHQQIQPTFDFALDTKDLSAVATAQQSDQVNKLALEYSQQPFDLSQDLMIRGCYLQLSKPGDSGQGVLLLNIHHIASDGWSMGVLVKEFVTQYRAILQALPDPLPPLAIQYADYAHWQRQWLSGDVLADQLAYWSAQLSDIPAVHQLPLDLPRPEMKGHQGAKVSSFIDASLAEPLQQLAAAHQLTPFMLLHGALALVLSRHSNTDDIVLGTPVANRMQLELEPLIGFFVNALVLRTDTSPRQLADYFGHIREVNLNAQANQDVPFEQLVEYCKVPRSTRYSPLFQIAFSMNTTEQREQTLEGLSFSTLDNTAIVAMFDLDISAEITADGIGFNWVYDTSLFTRAHIVTLGEHLNRLLVGMIKATKTTSLTELPMLSAQEEALLHQQQSYVLDQHRQLMPVGCTGELYVTKDDPQYQADFAVINNAFGDGSEVHLYQTSERVSFIEGELKFAGRVENQLQLGGFSIALADIEQQLITHPYIQTACVTAAQDMNDEACLVAYVQVTDDIDGGVDISAILSDHLHSELPEHMVPAAFVVVTQWPMGSDGKVDKSAFLAPEAAHFATPYRAPETTQEKALAELWAELLMIEPDTVSATANFFELGGHSLLAAVMVAQITEEAGIDLEIRHIFDLHSLADLAEFIDQETLQKRTQFAATDELLQDELELTI